MGENGPITNLGDSCALIIPLLIFSPIIIAAGVLWVLWRVVVGTARFIAWRLDEHTAYYSARRDINDVFDRFERNLRRR